MDWRVLTRYYQLARYDTDGNSSSAVCRCKLQCADLLAQMSEFSTASTMFESVADVYIDHPTLRWSAKNVIFKSIICCMAVYDVVDANVRLDRFVDKCAGFEDSREYNLLKVQIIYRPLFIFLFTFLILFLL